MAKKGDATERPVTGVAAFTIPGGGEQTLLLLLVAPNAEDVEAGRRAQQEDAAMDAEDVLTQVEEADAVDPVG